MLEEVPKEGESPKIHGSIMLALAESKEEVLEALKRDIYSESGVWDWNKVQIHPVCKAIRSISHTFLISTVQVCIQESFVKAHHKTGLRLKLLTFPTEW